MKVYKNLLTSIDFQNCAYLMFGACIIKYVLTYLIMAACIIGFIDNKMECVTKIEYGVLGNRIGVSKMLLAKSNVLTYLIVYFFL